MIHVVSIEVRGESTRGRFGGRLTFTPGLQVVSGRNSFGKTLVAEAMAWCLNLESMFGRKQGDSSFFPEAVLDELNLGDEKAVKVLSSEAALTLERDDGDRLELTRAITHDRDRVRIVRRAPGGPEFHLTLLTGPGAMTDAATGFQRFLFEWLGWPLRQITTFDGHDAFIYIENLAPLFYIEQTEGWTEIQARQIGRYGQQQIRELSVEYLLGALDEVDRRVARQRAATLDGALRASARALAERAADIFLRQGWAVDWSGQGSVKEIQARWSQTTLREALARDAEVDLKKLRAMATDRAAALRRFVTSEPIDPSNVSAAAAASQNVIDLKQRRHSINSELSALQAQYSDNEHLYESLGDRIRTATDVHRLKTTGVGRLAHLECPTCHRELDPEAFSLNEQTGAEVAAHIEALKRDRLLTRQTLRALRSALRKADAARAEVDSALHSAQRTLEDVNSTIGPAREQIVRAAATLSAQERVIERLDETETTLRELQDAVDRWLKEAAAAQVLDGRDTDIGHRLAVFTRALGDYLIALGHSAVADRGVADLRVDGGQYEPYLGRRRLKTLGSGSDPARLVGAYTLALAAASAALNGFHPGVVVLDEPLQQNPDTEHVDLLLEFLGKGIAKEAQFQTIIFTFLSDDETARLRGSGTTVITVDGHLLVPVSTPDEQVRANTPEAPEGPPSPSRG